MQVLCAWAAIRALVAPYMPRPPWHICVSHRLAWEWRFPFRMQEVMRDPVLCMADGQTYERAAITTWLQEHGTSYVTGALVHMHNLIPNHMLRNIIEAAGQSDCASSQRVLTPISSPRSKPRHMVE